MEKTYPGLLSARLLLRYTTCAIVGLIAFVQVDTTLAVSSTVVTTNQEIDWHKVLWVHFKNRNSLPSNFSNHRILAHKQNNMHVAVGDEGKVFFARIEVGVNGYEVFAKEIKDKYCLLTRQGIFLPIEPTDLKDQDFFATIRRLYRQNGVIQKLEFPNNFVFPKRNAEMFHPGRTLGDSLIEEKIGIAEKHDLPPNLQQYRGYPVSRLYRANPETALKGDHLGYLIDIFTPPDIAVKGKQKTMVLKRYIGSEKSIPEYIVTQSMPGLTVEDIEIQRNKIPLGSKVLFPGTKNVTLGTVIYYTNVAIDNRGNLDRSIPLQTFDEPLVIQGYNSH